MKESKTIYEHGTIGHRGTEPIRGRKQSEFGIDLAEKPYRNSMIDLFISELGIPLCLCGQSSELRLLDSLF